jgi:hypothetical protein
MTAFAKECGHPRQSALPLKDFNKRLAWNVDCSARAMGMIGAKTVVAVFESMPAAEGAKARLIRAGVPEKRIAVSAHLTDDGIAAEVPGQSYENQPGQPAVESEAARWGEAVRSGACVVSVLARSNEEIDYVMQLLRRENAYRTAIRR